MSKGSNIRPYDKERYDAEWDRIFKGRGDRHSESVPSSPDIAGRPEEESGEVAQEVAIKGST